MSLSTTTKKNTHGACTCTRFTIVQIHTKNYSSTLSKHWEKVDDNVTWSEKAFEVSNHEKNCAFSRCQFLLPPTYGGFGLPFAWSSHLEFIIRPGSPSNELFAHIYLLHFVNFNINMQHEITAPSLQQHLYRKVLKVFPDYFLTVCKSWKTRWRRKGGPASRRTPNFVSLSNVSLNTTRTTTLKYATETSECTVIQVFDDTSTAISHIS